MKCNHCGEEIDNDSVFCSFCGKKVSDNTNSSVINMVLGAILI